MKEAICKAFCDDIRISEVPIGLAVSTTLRRSDGDAVGFYIVKDSSDTYHLEDDGTTIPFLEASGVDFETATRQKALDVLLCEYDAAYDESECVIRSSVLEGDAVAPASIRFAALLLRLSDFLLLTQEHVSSAFKDDAKSLIRRAIAGRAAIDEDQFVNKSLSDVKADLILKAPDRDAVAVFLVQSAQKVNDAIFLQMAAQYESHVRLAVIALLEADHSVTAALRQRAANRLTAVPIFKNDEDQAVRRIVREALGREPLH